MRPRRGRVVHAAPPPFLPCCTLGLPPAPVLSRPACRFLCFPRPQDKQEEEARAEAEAAREKAAAEEKAAGKGEDDEDADEDEEDAPKDEL